MTMEKYFKTILKKIETISKEQDLGLATELKLYGDGSWIVELESNGKTIAQGENTNQLIRWAET